MFRTYQGWTALTRQGPNDGTLQLVPIAEGISYVLLRALQDDVPEDDLCGAQPGRALGVNGEMARGSDGGHVSIPEVQPGDTVWWHTDVCHAVGDEHAARNMRASCISARAGLREEPRLSAGQKEAFLPAARPGLRRDGLRVDFTAAPPKPT
jgi:hypothetical protein